MEITMALPHTGKLASPETISRVAEEAERMGCATVWVLERLLRPAGGSMPDHYATVYDPLQRFAMTLGHPRCVSHRCLCRRAAREDGGRRQAATQRTRALGPMSLQPAIEGV